MHGRKKRSVIAASLAQQLERRKTGDPAAAAAGEAVKARVVP